MYPRVRNLISLTFTSWVCAGRDRSVSVAPRESPSFQLRSWNTSLTKSGHTPRGTRGHPIGLCNYDGLNDAFFTDVKEVV